MIYSENGESKPIKLLSTQEVQKDEYSMLHASSFPVWHHTVFVLSLNSSFTLKKIQSHSTCQVGRDHQVQLLAPERTTQNPNLCLRALSKHSLNSDTWGHAHHPLVQHLSPAPAAPPLTQLHTVPSGPVAVTGSRAQHRPSTRLMRNSSHHEASPQLQAEQTQARQLFLIHLAL